MIHSTESATRLAYWICEALQFSPVLYTDDFYSMIDDIRNDGAVDVYLRWKQFASSPG